MAQRRKRLAQHLGPAVLASAAARVGAGDKDGFTNRKGDYRPLVYTFPERDGDGRVIGFGTRTAHGEKSPLPGVRPPDEAQEASF